MLYSEYQRGLEAQLLETLQTIADFAVGNGDVCEIIARRARAAINAYEATAIRGFTPQRDRDASQGDLQCPATLPHDDGNLNCRFVAGHGGKHKTGYVNGQEWTQDVSELEPLDWRPKREDLVEVPQPAKQTPKFCGKCRGAQNYAAIATGRYPCPNGCEGWPATPPAPQPKLSDMCECGVIYGEHSADTLATPLLHCPEKRSGVFWKWKDRTFRRAGVPVEPTPEVLTCSKCRIADSSVKKIGKGNYCSKCWAKIGPKYPPRAKDSFEFYDKIYHPTTGKPPATWEFADAYATYRIELAGVEQPTPKEAK